MGYGMQSPRGPAGTRQMGNPAGSNINQAPGIYREGKEGKRKKFGDYHVGQEQIYGPEAMQLYQQLFSHLGPDSYLSRLAGGDQSMFEEMEAPAMRQFQELTGQNASRFSGMGMGARKGSGFKNAQNQATADFAMNLQSRRQGLMQQAIKDLMGLSSELLDKRPSENLLMPKKQKKPGFWDTAGQSFAQGLGEAGASWLYRPSFGGGGTPGAASLPPAPVPV